MQKLIKNGVIADNDWQFHETFSAENAGNIILPFAEYLKLESRSANIGVRIEAGDDVESLTPYIEELMLVEVYFDKFADGRSFSHARLLREALDYKHELRASGAYMLDQIFYLRRCGVDAFLLPEDANVDTAINNLSVFTEKYQAACDEPQPLFRRRV